MLTAYDYSFAKILDEAGVDIVLVGDSLGNVILGYDDTIPVTMDDMVHHTQAVARGSKRALLISDLPYKSTADNKKALQNARRLVVAGAEGVKIEGVEDIGSIKKIVKSGIPVMGHLGLLPQKAKEYKIQRAPQIIDEAKKLEQAGVFSIVLEMVSSDLAKKVSESVGIPTIGIGSGTQCDGQVLVTYDLIGLSDWMPRFVKPKANLKEIISCAVKEWMRL